MTISMVPQSREQAVAAGPQLFRSTYPFDGREPCQ